jgi:hypothetical protein
VTFVGLLEAEALEVVAHTVAVAAPFVDSALEAVGSQRIAEE